MRKFILIRNSDVSGVSGTGVVAEGVIFSDNRVAMMWLVPEGVTPGITLFQSIEDVEKIHGHGGASYVAIEDESGSLH